MRIFQVLAGVAALSCISAPAFADAKSYCEIFGQDFASAKTSNVDEWQLTLPKRLQRLHGPVHQ